MESQGSLHRGLLFHPVACWPIEIAHNNKDKLNSKNPRDSDVLCKLICAVGTWTSLGVQV